MDKKGEIDYLSKIIEPDVGVITNINYAHAKNFKNIKQIALAKSEIIKNIKPNGYIVLNADDSFFHLHKKIAKAEKIKTVSYGIKNQKAGIKLIFLLFNFTTEWSPLPPGILKFRKIFSFNLNIFL